MTEQLDLVDAGVLVIIVDVEVILPDVIDGIDESIYTVTNNLIILIFFRMKITLKIKKRKLTELISRA